MAENAPRLGASLLGGFVAHEEGLLTGKAHANDEDIGRGAMDQFRNAVLLLGIFLKIAVMRAADAKAGILCAQSLCRRLRHPLPTAQQIDPSSLRTAKTQ